MDKNRIKDKLRRAEREIELLKACYVFDDLKLRFCDNDDQISNFKNRGMKYTGTYYFVFKNYRDKGKKPKNEAKRYKSMSEVMDRFKEFYEKEFSVDVGKVYLSSRIMMNVSIRSDLKNSGDSVLRGGVSITEGRQIVNDSREYNKYYNAALKRDES